jgi:TorA-specific chaperone
MTLSQASVSPASSWNALVVEWLAGLFMAPLSANAVMSHRDGLGASFLGVLADEHGCGPGVQRMRSALAADDSPVAVAGKLAFAFAVLFDGLGGHRTVSLYESAHVSASGRLFQAPVSEMNLLLRQADISINDTFREPPDHLSIELALLAQLMRRGTGRHAQAELLDDHLLAWVPMFVERCRDADSTGFYAGAAWVLSEFLRAQRTALQASMAMVPTPELHRLG